MASTLGPTQTGHAAFKKRVLRPWRPTPSSAAPSRQADIYTELLQKQLEPPLEVKTKQEALQTQLGLVEDHRITVGGFFQPSNLFSDTSKTWTMLQQAQDAFKQAKQTEDKIHQVECLKAKLEETVFGLEQKLKSSHENHAIAIQTIEQNLVAEQEGKRMEAELRKRLQNELTVYEERLQILEQHLQEKSDEASRLSQELEIEQQARSHAAEHQEQIEQTLQSSTEKTVLLQEKIEQLLLVQEGLLQEQAHSKEALFALQQQANKLSNLVECERDLRKLGEEQIQKMVVKGLTL